MIPVDQTIQDADRGNCFAACMASIFEVEIEAVPNFCAKPTWLRDTRAWLRDRGHSLMLLHVGATLEDAADALELIEAPTIVTGMTPRGVHHATVWSSGKLVHDPHPSRTGLIDVLDVVVIVPLRPVIVVDLAKAGARIRKLRKAAGMSLRELAFRTDVSHVFLGAVERGHKPTPARMLGRLVQVLPGFEP